MADPFNFRTPSGFKKYMQSVSLFSKDQRTDGPLRAKSVSLSERPRSKYARNVYSADTRHRYPERQLFHHHNDRNTTEMRRKSIKPSKITVKQQNRKTVEKLPFALSVQNLSIPIKYAEKRSTSKTQHVGKSDRITAYYGTKSANPPKQVDGKRLATAGQTETDSRRLCSTTGAKVTENKLLLQICEAEQVSDFERILNSNAIRGGREQPVWCGGRTRPVSSVGSAYSLHAVSQAYHYLFRQHEESLQPLIDSYRKAKSEGRPPQPVGLPQDSWYENLQQLAEFYEDDEALQQEIESITDAIVTEEIKAAEKEPTSGRNRNFEVNLTDLLGLHVNGEGCSPTQQEGPPDAEDDAEAKGWLGATMSATDDDNTQEKEEPIDRLAQNLSEVSIDGDATVPTITFSNCCDGLARSELPNNSQAHLAVPPTNCVDESRPPM